MYEPYEPETTEPTNNDIITNEIGRISKLNKFKIKDFNVIDK